ncbi:MAG: hypothetical protein IT384_21405 [Deltaproteobacteria bacterium]|nr:hypothetical protein [Deltaproteobacteria bacterium]
MFSTWSVAALLGAACLGCTVDAPQNLSSPEESPGPRVVSAPELASLPDGARLVVDTREGPVTFAPTVPALDFGRITLICPNGNAMPMDQWLDQSWWSDIPVESALFTLAVTTQDPPATEDCVMSRDPTCGCTRECWRCADGVWVCVFSCPEDGERLDTGEATRNPGHETLPPPPRDPPPGTEPDPGDPAPDDGLGGGDPPPDGEGDPLGGGGGSSGGGGGDSSGGGGGDSSGGGSGGSSGGGSGGSSGGGSGGSSGGGGGGGFGSPGP